MFYHTDEDYSLIPLMELAEETNISEEFLSNFSPLRIYGLVCDSHESLLRVVLN